MIAIFLLLYYIICFIVYIHFDMKRSNKRHKARIKKIQDDHEAYMDERFPIWKEGLLMRAKFEINFKQEEQEILVLVTKVHNTIPTEEDRKEFESKFGSPYEWRGTYSGANSIVELYCLTTNENIGLLRSTPAFKDRDNIILGMAYVVGTKVLSLDCAYKSLRILEIVK